MLRPALPNSPGDGTANALGLNQHDGVPTVGPRRKTEAPRANSPRPVHAALRAVRHQQVGVQIVGGRVSSIAGSVRIASPISDLSALVPS
jgi:hypothetical protein